MNREFIKEELFQLYAINSEVKKLNGRKREIEARLQGILLEEIENKNLKYIEAVTGIGSATLAYKNKLEIDDRDLLVELFGEMVKSKIKVEQKETIKVTNATFGNALLSLYKKDYKEHDLEQILSGLGLTAQQIKTATKKLKGDYLKDKELLESMGAMEDDLEEELDMIKEHKNWEAVTRFFGKQEFDKEKLKRAIFVSESLAFGTKFSDNEDEPDEAEEDE